MMFKILVTTIRSDHVVTNVIEFDNRFEAERATDLINKQPKGTVPYYSQVALELF